MMLPGARVGQGYVSPSSFDSWEDVLGFFIFVALVVAVMLLDAGWKRLRHRTPSGTAHREWRSADVGLEEPLRYEPRARASRSRSSGSQRTDPRALSRVRSLWRPFARKVTQVRREPEGLWYWRCRICAQESSRFPMREVAELSAEEHTEH